MEESHGDDDGDYDKDENADDGGGDDGEKMTLRRQGFLHKRVNWKSPRSRRGHQDTCIRHLHLIHFTNTDFIVCIFNMYMV